MKIRKNDKVTLNQPLSVRWSKEPIQAGTELVVWKSRQDGTLACSIVNSRIGGMTIDVPSNQVTKVTRNVVMPKVGDLFYSSWGYDQTNIDFYQVTKVLNKSIELTPIAGQAKYDQHMAGHTKPLPNQFTGEAKRHIVRFSTNDSPYVKLTSYSSAWPTSADQEHFFSEWA